MIRITTIYYIVSRARVLCSAQTTRAGESLQGLEIMRSCRQSKMFILKSCSVHAFHRVLISGYIAWFTVTEYLTTISDANYDILPDRSGYRCRQIVGIIEYCNKQMLHCSAVRDAGGYIKTCNRWISFSLSLSLPLSPHPTHMWLVTPACHVTFRRSTIRNGCIATCSKTDCLCHVCVSKFCTAPFINSSQTPQLVENKKLRRTRHERHEHNICECWILHTQKMRSFIFAITTFRQTALYFDNFWHTDTEVNLQQNCNKIAHLSW